MSHRTRGPDRRGNLREPSFPLTLPSGDVVSDDRRRQPDRRRQSLISRQALFADIPYSALEPLIERCELRQLAGGDVLLAPGQANQTLYLLVDGRLKVRIDRVDSQEGFLILPGECTGEISIVDGKAATAFVVADEPCSVLAIPEAVLWEDFLKVPGIAKNFMRLFAERFRARNQAMQQALEQELRYEHLQKELAIAHDLQLGMLPRHFDVEAEIDLAAEMTPARHIGGDFYDSFRVGSDEYCVAIGDVSGKGVPAALFMVRAMTLLRTEVLKAQPLEEAVRCLNVLLCEDNPTCMFATLIVGVLNKRTGSFRYVSAGHDPIVFGARGTGFRPLPVPRGILAGIDERATYELGALTLAPGDVLLLYTDGVTEAMNPDGELFHFERLLHCLEEAPVDSAGELAERIKGAVGEFTAGAPASDDLTLVILRYRGA